MSYIITRTNGKVTQVWENNEANWQFFQMHQSKDVHWRNIDGREDPKRWPDWWAASADLAKRQKLLRGPEKANEKNWQYHIIEEQKDGLDITADAERKAPDLL